MNIYVGNLSYDLTEQELRDVFSSFGEVSSVNIITDRYTGRSRGFAFVQMSVQTEAQAAIDNLNGKKLKGRNMVVNEARPRPVRRTTNFSRRKDRRMRDNRRGRRRWF